MPSHRLARSPHPAAARLTLLLLAATGAIAGACSSSNGSGTSTPTGATLSADQVTLVDSVLSTTEADLARYASGAPGDGAQFKPEGLGLGSQTYKCSVSGTATVSESQDTNEAGVQVHYENCDSGSLRIDGSLALSCSQNGTSITDALNGSVDVTLYTSDGGIALAANLTFSDFSVSTSGGETTESGTISIGGTVYSSSNLDYQGVAPTACAALLGEDAGVTSGGDGGVPSGGDGGGAGAGACVIYLDDAGNVADSGIAGQCLVTTVNGTNTSGPPCANGLTYAPACPTAQLVGCCTRHAASDSKTVVLYTECDYTDLGQTGAQLQSACVTPIDDGGAPGTWSTSPP